MKKEIGIEFSISTSIASVLYLVIFMASAIAYKYSQRYIYTADMYAQKGIILQETRDLSLYINVGEGAGIFGKYTVYSDGSTEPLIVYGE